ncbi:DUF4870 domain-containing protein [Spongiimicrobium sp. 3-5]|uniref:DUF4870 domain-containing protein n=1 Tax=Spongiimicrobium sp. 3-5 TaxID=3332596 RepID=UPI0039817F0B
MDEKTINEGKTMAIISYITLIGVLIAYLMNNDKKNAFAKFHIGQALRVWLLGVVLAIGGTMLVIFTGIGAFGYLSWVAWILAVLGLVNAVNGKTEKVPLVGSIGE